MEQIYLFLDSNPLISIIFFAILQLWVFIPTLRKLSKFKNFFPDSQKWEVEKGETGYSIMIGNSSNKLNELVNEINEYLAKNEGTTDFGIIKDKVQNMLKRSTFARSINRFISDISKALDIGIIRNKIKSTKVIY